MSKPLFKGFHLEREEDGGATRPAMRTFDAVALPIFHSRREAWKFLRGWSRQGLTTEQLKKKGYRCLPVKVLKEDK